MRATLRERRQITLPRAVCEELGLGPGDTLDLRVEDGAIIVRPGRVAALEALGELRRAIAESGVTEEEMQESGRQIREELVRERWPHLFPPDGPKD